MYIEDDNWLYPKRRMLRFRHNYDLYFKPSIPNIFCKPCSQVSSGQHNACILVDGTVYKKYSGTSALLYHQNGSLLCTVSTFLHPKDKFSRLEGRTQAQSKLSWFLVHDVSVPDHIKSTVLAALNNNKEALPLDW